MELSAKRFQRCTLFKHFRYKLKMRLLYADFQLFSFYYTLLFCVYTHLCTCYTFVIGPAL